MRIPRKIQLSQDGGMVHKCWRAHDKSFLLRSEAVKKRYLQYSFSALSHKSVQNQVQIHAYCVMNNHSHQLVSYKLKSEQLSNFMKLSHGGFASEFNRTHKREGAVGSGRPKTPLIQPGSVLHKMRVHFYIEANPLRAGIVRNLKLYTTSSYRFYAWGIEDEFTKKLTTPDWYLRLGKTPKQRQAKYRSLFDKYVKEMLITSPLIDSPCFIGDPIWCWEQKENRKQACSQNSTPTQKSPP